MMDEGLKRAHSSAQAAMKKTATATATLRTAPRSASFIRQRDLTSRMTSVRLEGRSGSTLRADDVLEHDAPLDSAGSAAPRMVSAAPGLVTSEYA